MHDQSEKGFRASKICDPNFFIKKFYILFYYFTIFIIFN